ncbi:MAG: anti-sigma factor [Flavisolibacter sp.]|nr:anti-sigma factor [Flavisolibacter sp.]
MNVKEYIQSGVVESYVLGVATEAERQEFEQLCATNPEIVEARNAFERSLEVQLMQDAIQPPAFLKEKIQLLIGSAGSETYQPEIIEEAPVRRMNVWKLVAAACFIALLGVGYWAYTSNEKYNDAVARQSSIEKELQQKNTQLAALEQDAGMMQKPGIKMAALKGTPNAPQALTTVFWDSTSKDVYLLVNNLPQAASDKQYQLWALLDGKPIDLGMLELQQNRLLVKMKNVQNAQAFAITLEPKGGSPAPTMTAMYVSGEL